MPGLPQTRARKAPQQKTNNGHQIEEAFDSDMQKHLFGIALQKERI